mmetsp:Transcript_73977/g.203668  ORF Transcript_73977/g.203668 Transcript_73977/m.203668 type:complete len:431 (-) Transcript_73977:234-1526(-)
MSADRIRRLQGLSGMHDAANRSFSSISLDGFKTGGACAAKPPSRDTSSPEVSCGLTRQRSHSEALIMPSKAYSEGSTPHQPPQLAPHPSAPAPVGTCAEAAPSASLDASLDAALEGRSLEAHVGGALGHVGGTLDERLDAAEAADRPSDLLGRPFLSLPPTNSLAAGGGGGAAGGSLGAAPPNEGTSPPDSPSAPRRVTLQLARLNELCAGKLDSLSYNQMCQQYPAEYAARQSDKLNYRYPGVGGESYQDVILRVDEAILMMEQSRDNLILICDRAVLRVLLAYFLGEERPRIPYMEVGAGVVELRRSHSGFHRSHTYIGVGAATRAAGPGTRGQQQATNSLEMQPSPRVTSRTTMDSDSSAVDPYRPPRVLPSFVESPFTTKAEYEAWVKSGRPLPSASPSSSPPSAAGVAPQAVSPLVSPRPLAPAQ